MTISKAYALLETEGLLERNRGKPMTVAARRRGAEAAGAAAEQLQPQAQHLVLAAAAAGDPRQDLELLLRRIWRRLMR